MRKMAANAGMAIDETYLSKAEVLDQMVRMESAYIGLTIRKPAKRVYSEIVALYKGNRSEYDRLLKEAKSLIDKNKSVQEQFMAWLAAKVSPGQLSMLSYCYPRIEHHCLRINVLQKPLFETTDLGTISKVEKAVTSRGFKLIYNNKTIFQSVKSMIF